MNCEIENWVTKCEKNNNNIYHNEKKKLHLFYHFDIVRDEEGKKDLEKSKKHILSRKIQNKPQSMKANPLDYLNCLDTYCC